jgi:two-component system, cell cycle response regulator DivK
VCLPYANNPERRDRGGKHGLFLGCALDGRDDSSRITTHLICPLITVTKPTFGMPRMPRFVGHVRQGSMVNCKGRMTKRILVIEDQEDLRRILRDLLVGSGYVVAEAADGAEGVTNALVEQPDLILMDIQLPVLDGYEAARQIRANPKLASTPIIAVSSFAMKGDEEKARAAGCDHYVTKPYSPIQLLRTVRTLLGEQS